MCQTFRKCRDIGILEYWNIGKKQRSEDEKIKSFQGLSLGFSIIPSFHYSNIPAH